MKAKTKFMKMFNKLPDQARRELIFSPYGNCPVSLNVIMIEIKQDTFAGKSYLALLGYKDD